MGGEEGSMKEEPDELELLTKQRDDLSFFVKMVAHDLGNKLSVLSVYNQLEPNPSEYTHKVSGVIRDMADFLDNLTYLVRIGEKATYGDKVSLYDIADKVIREFKPFTKEIKFVLHFLPTIKGHHTQIEQIFHNLLINIIRHAEASKVEIWCKYNTNDIQIFIRDNGKGIAPFYQQRIRAMWNKYKTTDATHGLGLLIAKKVVMDHGGAINFSSGHKNGTTFRITFPLERVIKE